MNDKFLYCYKMTYDTGFAPNPDHGILTLATCKPTIRRCAKEGYWISGWTAATVHDRNNNIVHFKDEQKLIYLAEISKVISYAEYWANYKQKYPIKMFDGKPVTIKGCGGKSLIESECYYDNGDNIYEPSDNETFGFKQHPNGGNHGDKEKEHDLSGKNVLICKRFYYFGVENAIKLEGITPIPRCKKFPFPEALKIIDQVTHSYKEGINQYSYENNLK